jgi:peptidylprolyl isomerase
MNTLKKFVVFCGTVLIFMSCSTSGDNKNSFVLIKTTLGNITVRLYDETPGHRDNFIKLVRSHVYDGVTFHRVIKDFMIQGGDPETKTGYIKKEGDTLTIYTIPAEFNPALFHKKGALAAARQGNDVNPQMRSSGTQFYIVQGVKYTDETLNQPEQRIVNNRKQALFISLLKQVSDSAKIKGLSLSDAEIQEKASSLMFEKLGSEPEFKIPENQRNIYKNIGGVPRLDGTYTVFGEVVEGLDIVDRIADAKTNENDKPLADIRIIKTQLIYK